MSFQPNCKPEDVLLFRTSPEVHDAVYAVAGIAEGYASRRIAENNGAPYDDLFQTLIRFFANYDRARTDQVENLKARLIESMMRESPRANHDGSPAREDATA